MNLKLTLDLKRKSKDKGGMRISQSQPSPFFLPLFAFVMAVAVALTSGCKDNKKPEAAPEPTVEVVAALQETIPITRSYVGTVEGYQNAKIQARVVGYLKSRNYKEGSLVKKGSVLFEIDPRPFEAALEQAKGTFAQAEAKAQLAQTTLARQTELYKTNVISAQEFDQSTQSARADIAAAKSAAAAVDNAKLNLDFCTITAPFTGIAGIANAQVGDLVGSGSNMVLTEMSQVDPIKVYFPISEQEYMVASKHLQELMQVPVDKRKADMTLLLANGETYSEKGRFEFANRNVGVTTGTILISALFPNPNLILRPGQFAKVGITVKMLPNAILVPQRAVNQLQTAYQIGVVNKDGTVEVRTVDVGDTYKDYWVIKEGISAGETIIVEGIQKVRTGMKVKTEPFKEQGAQGSSGNSEAPQKADAGSGEASKKSSDAESKKAPADADAK
ncbi:MAG: efflux RND transporter periplasmic adaptor subunit [Chthoniobacterales bacterium]